MYCGTGVNCGPGVNGRFGLNCKIGVNCGRGGVCEVTIGLLWGLCPLWIPRMASFTLDIQFPTQTGEGT